MRTCSDVYGMLLQLSVLQRVLRTLQSLSVGKLWLSWATTYEEVIGNIRAAKQSGGSGLQHGQGAPSGAGKILYTTLYPGEEDQKRMQALFEYNMKCASSYVFL